MGVLVSVNVGLPKDVPWQGRTVFTGVFKDPVTGPRRVRKLNLDGDGQGDLAGHGGEQRAVFVYQIDSYRYWERELGRNDLVHGQFGENFTIEGLSDDEVCIGDRYRIGTAVFEVTQPRVTCYRVGIRMNDPRIPALLVSHRRPGFYFRVLEEGEVQAGDEIVKLASGPEQMTVAEADALLYLPGHPRQQLLRALRIPALSPGWQASFRALLDGAPGGGNAGLAATSPPPAWPGFRRADGHRDRPRERLRDLHPPRRPRRRAAPAAPSRAVPDGPRPARPRAAVAAPQLLPLGPARRRLLPDHRQARTRRRRQRLPAHPPRASATSSRSQHRAARSSSTTPTRPSCSSAPASAPLQRSPCSTRSPRRTPSGRSGGCTARAAAATTPSPPRPARSSRRSRTCMPTSATAARAPTTSKAATSTAPAVSPRSLLAELAPPRDAEAYLCGPVPFMDEISAGLAAIGIDASRIHTEPFGPAPGLTPGIAATPARTPHAPAGAARHRPDDRVRAQQPRRPAGAATTAACSSSPKPATSPSAGRAAPASATPARPRSIAGDLEYSPDPVEPAADGSALICCSQPRDDVVLDL